MTSTVNPAALSFMIFSSVLIRLLMTTGQEIEMWTGSHPFCGVSVHLKPSIEHIDVCVHLCFSCLL